MKQPKILIWDIETSYILAHTFSLYPERIHPANVVEDWRIHSIAWKWHGKKRVYSVVEENRCDKNVLEAVYEVLCEADYLVHHNGDAFDLKKFNARLVRHKLPPLPPIKTVDTLKKVRAILKDTSHRLDCLGDYYEVGRKISNSPKLWTRAFFGEKKALAEMVKYNRQDVVLLENVFDTIRPYIKHDINLNLHTEGEVCPNCGGTHHQSRGYYYTATSKKRRLQCNSCHKWFTSTKSDKIVKVK